jgi:anti-sigma factor RsiW
MPMDHVYAEEHGLVESYLKDRLSESEREAFEAHYFACETCMEQLEAASDFREGMLQVAAEETARTQVGLLAGLALLSRGRRLALAALVLLLALPFALLVANRGFERRLAVARITPAAAPGGEPRIASREQKAAAGPQVNLPLFTLAAVRGGEEAGREPVNRVPLAAATTSAVFTLELAAVEYPSYRASLRDESGKETWQARDLRPDSRDSLVLLLPSRMLPPGLYRLTIEGVKEDRKSFPVAAYPFRVVRP